ncbi:ATP-binding cassette domain-containing protein [Pontibacter diazotrophicus]|uniref:ATP-binding cassette domain-containing protein n=1 Tax=Pontibacter diazotrophicus TaxID=1400979 RepID=A0A3D8L979_9BACT|nr:ATP-binding cassette domain-containing protein [Pontibacter diazotrophicus]RDV13955.1 ATP-binding cassette domain-containing protein [Pontibacter diazotrophicus]
MIRLRNVTKRFGGLLAVDDVTLDVKEGETLVLLGTSGCGKTTTLKLINRLEELTAGTIEVAGTNIQQQKPEDLRRKMGYVIQGAGLFPHYTVQENIAVVPRLLHWSKEKIDKRTHEVLELLRISPQQYLSKYPHELSGGQQQRVGLARALISDPPVILMDEPFGALDPITRISIRREFKNIEALRHKTKVLVTHDVLEAFELGDRICLMDNGKIQQLGTTQELVFRPANEFVMRFLQDHLFQLQLQVLQLHQLRPYLPAVSPANATDAIVFPESESVLEAIQILTATGAPQQSLTLEANTETPPQAATVADLMAAVEQLTPSLRA